MVRTKNARGEIPANFEQGSSSRRARPRHSPESAALVAIPPNPANAYPFNARMRMTRIMSDRESKLHGYKVLNPIYPDCALLTDLGLFEDLSRYFDDNGFGYVFRKEPPRVYEAMVREFVYSFQPEWEVIPKERSKFNIVEKHVVSWNFQLGGIEYTYSRSDLWRVFGMGRHSSYPFVHKSMLDDFWKLITCGTANFAPAEQSTKIVLPIWRLVHRFIASSVILRKDEGRWVTKTDLELMYCFYEHTRFDSLIPITRSLAESTTPTFRGLYISGGPIISLIAEDIGLALDLKFALRRKVLGQAEMVRRGFLKLKRDYRGTHRLVVGRDISAPNEGERPPPQPAAPSPHPSQDIPSSSAAPRPDTLESLTASFHHFVDYVQDHFRWQGDSLRDIYTRMGYDNYIPPPQYSAMPSRDDDMAGPSGTAGDMEVEDEEATASDSGNDGIDGAEAD